MDAAASRSPTGADTPEAESQGGFFSDEETDEEDDEPNNDEELQNFRLRWQQELAARAAGSPPRDTEGLSSMSTEEQARYFFMLGVSAEQSHQLYDAISYYRKAVQLVPDIEFRIDELKTKHGRRRRVRQESDSSVGSVSSLPDEDDYDVSDLCSHFSRLGVGNKQICQPEVPTQNSHISLLPVEVLVYIFKWVISADLDLHSLERLSEVCRGFYVCARDEELWRLICLRVWGRQCEEPRQYGSWRNMYLLKPHLRFNGVYISKCSYFRLGEASMDTFYKPFLLVEYYRYVRFFPEGQLLMLSSPEDPTVMVQKLRHRSARVQGVMHGYYRLAGDQLTAVMKRRKVADERPKVGYYKYRRPVAQDTGEQTFHVDWQLKSSGKRLNAQLHWQHYTAHTKYKTGEETVAEFELTQKTYPPLLFSGVRSFTCLADSPLC